MLRVFLAHTPEMFAGYYGDRALAALQEHAEVVRNPGASVLTGAALAKAARGCQAIVADRATPGTAETFAAAPDLVAFLRVAVDISTIDVPAASAASSARSSTSSPRERLMNRAPRFMRAKAAASNRSRVSGIEMARQTTKSDSASTSAKSRRVMRGSSTVAWGSDTSTRIPSASATSASRRAIRP